MRAPEFWKHRGLAARMLAPLGALYGASVAWKARKPTPFHAGAKVICVGNLTAGGSGKTPVAIAIAGALCNRGAKVFFLTRGYGGQERGPLQVTHAHNAADVGDEALLLARTAPTIVARDRAQGAALATSLGAGAIVMDDGHQNFTLAKDLSLVVVDGQSGFGNGLMIPAGPLREPVRQGLARADAVIVIGSGGQSPEDGRAPVHSDSVWTAPGGHPDLQGYAGPVLHARLKPLGAGFQNRRVFAFAGIGRPEKFTASLLEAGALVTGAQYFPDHHVYRPGEIAALKARAQDAQLITTEKDFVRLSAAEREGIAVLQVEAAIENGLQLLLDRLLT
jgi:tetraacyldisaccharide 4'-kinase